MKRLFGTMGGTEGQDGCKYSSKRKEEMGGVRFKDIGEEKVGQELTNINVYWAKYSSECIAT